MHDGLLRAIHQRMSARPDEELLRLWVENDRFHYSAETFEAVRSILTERGIAPPPQNDPPPMAERAPEEAAPGERGNGGDDPAWTAWVRPFLWIGAALGAAKLLTCFATVKQYFDVYERSRFYRSDWRIGVMVAEVALSLALACCLLVGVWAALRRRRWARRILSAYVLAALALTTLRILFTWYAESQRPYGIPLEMVLQQPESVLQPNVYPLVLLVLLRRPAVRSLLEPTPGGFDVAPATPDGAASPGRG
jgi:hypothetical protein